LIATPRDADGRDRQEQHGHELQDALAIRDGVRLLAELMGRVDVYMLGHEREN
jgi:hypothetical protein